jgi:hypothetical protein
VNEPAPNFQRQKHAALSALMGVAFVFGVVEAALSPAPGVYDNTYPLQLLNSVIMFVIGFYWLHFDARELDIRRPTWLNIGIVLFAIVFVPYYLYKTRPAGRRAQAIWSFFGLLLASVMLSTIGVVIMTAVSGGNPGT